MSDSADLQTILERPLDTDNILERASREALEERIARLEAQLSNVTTSNLLLPDEVRQRIERGENPVRAVRRWRLMTQKELADSTELGANHISRIENGAQFNIRTARALADALNVRIDDIS